MCFVFLDNFCLVIIFFFYYSIGLRKNFSMIVAYLETKTGTYENTFNVLFSEDWCE